MIIAIVGSYDRGKGMREGGNEGGGKEGGKEGREGEREEKVSREQRKAGRRWRARRKEENSTTNGPRVEDEMSQHKINP